MGAQAKKSGETPPEAELSRVLKNIRIGLVFADRPPAELDSHMGWSDVTRSRKLNGHRRLLVPELHKLAGYLGLTQDDLFLAENKFVALVARGMSREELLRKLAQSACLRVVDPAHGQTDLFDAALPPAELTVVVD